MSKSRSHNQTVQTRSVLEKIGLIAPIKIATTLQGSVWRGSCSPLADEKEGEQLPIVVKVSDKNLAEHSLAKVGNATVAVQEDVVKEASILRLLNQTDARPESIVGFHRLYLTNKNYYLVMEDAGVPLFGVVLQCHEMIRTKVLPVSHWTSVVRIIFAQMVACVQYIHDQSICHFDISLENFCINDMEIKLSENADESEVVHFVTDKIRVKLCDFGLAEQFEGSTFTSNKFVGKTGYKSPEVTREKKGFNAKANDVWCLGVTLFMMLTGAPPWRRADMSDALFACVMKGQMSDVLTFWGSYDRVGDAALDLLQRIFINEERRIGLSDVSKHPWMSVN